MVDRIKRKKKIHGRLTTNFAGTATDGMMILRKALEVVGPDRKKRRDCASGHS